MMIPVLAAIGFMLTATLGSSITAEPQNVHPDAILPDISPGVPKHLNIHNQQQNEYLRFTNVWANVGDGTLEFFPEDPFTHPVEGELQNAKQYLYDENGDIGNIENSIWNATVSSFIFHETHNHWHIDDIGLYSLRTYDENNPTTPGDIVPGMNSTKVGFCITNVFKYDGSESPTSQRTYWDCEVGFQGIEPGWADQYHQSTDGNQINMTGLANDHYFLVHSWNPESAFVDADNTNDEAWVLFELSQENNGNGNRKITIVDEFAPECQDDGSTPGLCGDLNKNS